MVRGGRWVLGDGLGEGDGFGEGGGFCCGDGLGREKGWEVEG